jgi:hypothetical protein
VLGKAEIAIVGVEKTRRLLRLTPAPLLQKRLHDGSLQCSQLIAERIAGSQWARFTTARSEGRANVRTQGSGANGKNTGPECLNVGVVGIWGSLI